MSDSVHHAIKIEYERRQKLSSDSLEARIQEVYSKLPRIREIDAEIQIAGVKFNRLILLGANDQKARSDMKSSMEELKSEKVRLLTGAGYPSNHLEPAYICRKCSDTGFIADSSGAEKCSCYKQLMIEHLYSYSNLKLTEKENFSTFDEGFYPDECNEKEFGIDISPRENVLAIKESCLEFIENFKSPDVKNLFFSGPTGVGKTFMSNCIAMELLGRGYTVLYQTSPVLFNTINEYKMRAFKDDDYQDAGYKSIFEADLLIIDDLGTEPMSSSRYAEFLNILNTRQVNNLTKPCKTIISTNIGVRELYEYYDERVASRIIGSFDMYRFAGSDIRRIKQYQE